LSRDPFTFAVLDPARLLDLRLAQQRCRYEERDTMLYALGVGFGGDPTDLDELHFVYEQDLKVVPTQATVLGWDRSWIGETGLDWRQVVHGEQRIELHAPFAAAGEVSVASRVTEVLDKGSGALFRVESRLTDVGRELHLCTSTTSFFVRGAGGFAPARDTSPARATWPQRPPDAVDSARTWPHQALLYRLSGDRNPHHAWPPAARAGGFERPLLHGLSTYGFACRSILRTFCAYDPARIARLDARFVAPVFPGDALRFELWRQQDEVVFRGSCPERAGLVIEGCARLRNTAPPADP
jgi:acyl dehydratase